MSVTTSSELEVKDPAAILDYAMEWGDWLGADVLDTVTWSVPAGITKTDESKSATTATIWLSGGSNSVSYTISCTVTTLGGRTNKRTMTIAVGARNV